MDNTGGSLSEAATVELEAVTAPARFVDVVVEQSSVGEGEGGTPVSLRSRLLAQGSPSSKLLVESR